MMNGTTNPIMNAANVGSANSAHHFRIALPAMLIIACLLSFLLHSDHRGTAVRNSCNCWPNQRITALFSTFPVFTLVMINGMTRNVKRCHFYMS